MIKSANGNQKVWATEMTDKITPKTGNTKAVAEIVAMRNGPVKRMYILTALATSDEATKRYLDRQSTETLERLLLAHIAPDPDQAKRCGGN